MTDTLGPHFASFAAANCVHTKGRWGGQALIFEPWQRAFFDEALRIDPATGKRVYSEVVLGIPRKNSKSTMASAFALYMLGGDGYYDPSGLWHPEAGPEVYSAAAAQNQAGIVFKQARDMVGRSPTLRSILVPRQYQIENPRNDGIYRVLSADAPLQHGLNPSSNIIDEYHAHRTPDLYEALTTGSGAREQPLTLTISTAGTDLESPLGLLYQRAQSLPDVEHHKDRVKGGYYFIARDEANGFLMWWYGADEDDDLEDPVVWEAVNPASWITPEYLQKQLNKGTLRREAFFQLHLNRWFRVKASALPFGAWAKCYEPKLVCNDTPACEPGTCLRGFDPSLPLAVAVDVALKNDSTAVTMAQKQGDRTITRTRIWVNPYPKNHTLFDYWQTPLEEVKDYLKLLRREFPTPAVAIDGEVMAGPRFAFDPMFFGNEARELAGEGLAMEAFLQTDTRMVPASETFYRLVVNGELAHDGSPQVNAQIANAIAEPKGNGRWRLSRPRGSTQKIDAAITNAIASYIAQEPPPVVKTVSKRVVFG